MILFTYNLPESRSRLYPDSLVINDDHICLYLDKYQDSYPTYTEFKYVLHLTACKLIITDIEECCKLL